MKENFLKLIDALDRTKLFVIPNDFLMFMGFYFLMLFGILPLIESIFGIRLYLLFTIYVIIATACKYYKTR